MPGSTSLSQSSESVEDARPLVGQKVLVTRPDSPGVSLTRRLVELGAEVHTYPLISISPPQSWDAFDQSLARLENIDWVIFTSRKGAEGCLHRLTELGKSPTMLRGLRIACIGPATAEVLQKYRLKVDLIPMQHQSEGLLEELKKQHIEGLNFWLIQAEEPREILKNGLLEMKAEVLFTPVYRNRLPDSDFTPLLKLLQSGDLDWLVLVSASAVQNLFRIIPAEWKLEWASQLKVACLGEITANAAKNNGLRVDVQPEVQDFSHLLEALCEHVVRT